MNEIEAQIAHYEAERARHRKLGFRFGFIALGLFVLNMLSSIIFTWLSRNANDAELTIFQLSEVLQLGLPVFGILGVVQRNKAVNARKMVESLQLIMLQAQNKPGSAAGPSQPAAAPAAVQPASPAPAAAPKSAAASRAAKASKNKS
jgi:hypothetical protein